MQGSVLFLGGNEVKSSAVVKYSSAPPQAAFARLQEKTDLKLPPANWLRESAKLGPAGTTILGNSKKSKPFSSINGDGAAQPVPSTSKQHQEGPVAGESDEAGRASWPAPFEMPSSLSEDPGASNQGLKNDFVRNILWTFEDIHMLVGSNMPIFGGGRYPAVSLRLRDNNKPINVLTGIDYWLDNLICNVPELVMCFHVNGIVQKYEMIKTEDIPNLENSNFSTKVIKDIAQNILSFLKSNCTKEGHTYWLFKASGSDIVKLYDLTTLCEETEDKYQNPFTMPVAILLYKVACNMMLKKNQNKKHYGTIRTLLLNCLKLLDNGRHPQIIASANYMLSELFQLDEPKKEDSTDFPINGNSDESYSEEEEEMPDSDENGSYSNSSDPPDDNKAVAIIKSVGELSVPEKYKSVHRIRGLKSVDSSVKKEGDLPAADPSTPIPLKYEDESTSGGPECLEKQMALFLDKMGSFQKGKHSSQSGMIPGSWQYKMKLQLILKSSRAYYVLSDAAMILQKYGRALRYIKLALQCHGQNSVGRVGDEHLRKQHRVLAELHYSKAVRFFQLLRDAPCEFLRVQLERVAFAEFQMASQNSSAGKLKTLFGALDIMTKTKSAFQLIRKELVAESEQISKDKSPAESVAPSDSSVGLNKEEVLKLLSIFESRMSFLLLQSIKLLTSSKKKIGGTSEEEVALKTNKQVYSLLLRATANKGLTLLERTELLLGLLAQLDPGPEGSQ
ncbi:hypothetical protein WISP_139844 [Willisornis vidua]|uniref:Erythroid differentiation-related factor 1 n=1 Tax=Willisornis vidua TaxID=1566151 RepID=A0ABQ9CSJ2_9PASS|nr:hypothetical protein WISP_139844 [Willisornis vidua]